MRLWPSKESLWFNVALIKETKVASKMQSADELPEPVVEEMLLQIKEAKRLFVALCDSIRASKAQARVERKRVAQEKRAERAKLREQRRITQQEQKQKQQQQQQEQQQQDPDDVVAQYEAVEEEEDEGVEDMDEAMDEDVEGADDANDAQDGGSIKKAREYIARCEDLLAQAEALKVAALQARLREEATQKENAGRGESDDCVLMLLF
jgi:hypothetical protein